jgi:hypothetical protein
MASPDQKTPKDTATADVRAVEAILRRWDPINVEPGSTAPTGEYESYAPHLVSMVRNGCTLDEVRSRLEYLASETMGIGASTGQSKKRSDEFAAQIIEAGRPSKTPADPAG